MMKKWLLMAAVAFCAIYATLFLSQKKKWFTEDNSQTLQLVIKDFQTRFQHPKSTKDISPAVEKSMINGLASKTTKNYFQKATSKQFSQSITDDYTTEPFEDDPSTESENDDLQFSKNVYSGIPDISTTNFEPLTTTEPSTTTTVTTEYFSSTTSSRTLENLAETTGISTETTDDSPETTDDSLETTASTEPKSRKIKYCNPDSILRKNSFKLSKNNISCVSNKASEGSCRWAEELYHPDERVRKCDPAPVVEICRIEAKRYRCSLRDCLKYRKRFVLVWKVNNLKGKLEQFKWFDQSRVLEASLVKISLKTQNEGYGFVLLQCVNKGEEEIQSETSELGQLLILQPSYQSSKRDKNSINLNIIMLDSASRSHFYRSLHKTINTFEQINQDVHTKTEILDFELFQSIAGHTNHILHGLFTGKLFPSNATEDEKQLVNFGAFFKRFSEEGYRTLYHDDMCYDQVWGLRLNLGTPRKWEDFRNLLGEHHIHSTGLTFSSCHLLHHNGVKTPFNGPHDRSLCYNGQFMDAYHLTFNHLQHQYSAVQQNKLFTLNVICVAHDDQDHGNTYTSYATGVQGRYEQFHPSLFMIVPEGVQKSLGEDIMKNLRENQFKLLTIMDLHQAFVTLPKKPSTRGIFGEISNQRSCSDLPLVLPNFCVCQNWSTPLKNDSSLVHFLHFAVGKLNTDIINSQKGILQNGFSMKCKFLIPTSFSFITQRINGKTKITSFDFEVASGNVVEENFEKFHAEVESVTLVERSDSLNMKLFTFDRISPYGPYRACANKNTNIKLCICDDDNSVTNDWENWKNLSKLDMPKQITLTPVRDDPCIHIHQIVYPVKIGFHSITYHLINKCRDSYNVALLFYDKLKNLRPSTPLPFRGVLRPYGAVFMGNVVRMRKGQEVSEPRVKVKVMIL